MFTASLKSLLYWLLLTAGLPRACSILKVTGHLYWDDVRGSLGGTRACTPFLWKNRHSGGGHSFDFSGTHTSFCSVFCLLFCLRQQWVICCYRDDWVGVDQVDHKLSILWLHRRAACVPAEFRLDRLPNPHRTGNGVPVLRILPATKVSLHLAGQQSQQPSGQSKSTCQDHTAREAQNLSGHGTVGLHT